MLDEIASCKDIPSEAVYDKFEEKLFAATPLERPILGTAASVRKISAAQMSAYVAETFLPWEDFYECTEVHDALDSTLVDCTWLRIFTDTLDGSLCLVCGFACLTVDCNSSVIVSIDCNTVLLTESLDVLSARTNEGTDLVDRYLEGFNLRSKLADWLRLVDAFLHD